MADIHKHDSATNGNGGPLSLYCFPEITSDGKAAPSLDEKASFVGRAADCLADTVMRPMALEGLADADAASDDCTAPDIDIEAIETAAFNKGVEQGRTEAADALRETVENAVFALNAALASLQEAHQQNLQVMETETVHLALAIAKKIIGVESNKALVIQHVVRTVLEKVPNPRHLVLRLNPADMDAITAIKPELIADSADMSLSLQEDAAIQRGGCIVETQLGDVDARIDQQIKMTETLLTDKLPRLPHEK